MSLLPVLFALFCYLLQLVSPQCYGFIPMRRGSLLHDRSKRNWTKPTWVSKMPDRRLGTWISRPPSSIQVGIETNDWRWHSSFKCYCVKFKNKWRLFSSIVILSPFSSLPLSELGVLRQKLSEGEEERAQLERKVTELSATVSSTLASYAFLEQALAAESTKSVQSSL